MFITLNCKHFDHVPAELRFVRYMSDAALGFHILDVKNKQCLVTAAAGRRMEVPVNHVVLQETDQHSGLLMCLIEEGVVADANFNSEWQSWDCRLTTKALEFVVDHDLQYAVESDHFNWNWVM